LVVDGKGKVFCKTFFYNVRSSHNIVFTSTENVYRLVRTVRAIQKTESSTATLVVKTCSFHLC